MLSSGNNYKIKLPVYTDGFNLSSRDNKIECVNLCLLLLLIYPKYNLIYYLHNDIALMLYAAWLYFYRNQHKG